MRPAASAQSAVRPTGVIDTLSAGYGVVNRHLWVVLIPILVDLFLLFGPQVSAAHLVSQTLSQRGPLAANRLLDEGQQRDVVELVEGYNLYSALASSAVHVPSLMAAIGIRDPLKSTAAESWKMAAAILFAALLGGMMLGSLYYGLLAQQVRDGRLSFWRLPGAALRACLHLIGYLLLLLGVGLLFGLPLGLLIAGAFQISPVIGNLAMTLVIMGMVWVWVYLFFVPEAIFVSRVGPLRAIKNSVAVVRRYFTSAVGIVVLVTVILIGMGRVWELVSQGVQPWGIGLGIVGNAYVASGLIAASMLYYRERIALLSGVQRTLSREQ